MQFKNLADMQKGLISIIQDALVTTDDVRSEVARVESKAVEEYVYAKYTPEQYRRRGLNGGLSDPDNLELMEEGNNGKTIRLAFENTTMGNDSMEGEYISDGIETGEGMDWENSDGEWSNPRPFLIHATEELKSNDNLRQSVIKSLKSKKLNAK